MPNDYKIAYNLTEFESIGWLPTAWVVKCTEEGNPAYADHKVYKHTIVDYGLENTPERQELFDIIEILQLDKITKKFNGTNKRPKPLAKLLADKLIKREIVRYVQRKLDEFLEIIHKNRFLLCLDFDRKDYIPSKVVHYPEETPSPELFFKRTEKGIAYRLSFSDKTGSWKINTKEMTVLVNNPAWVVIDMKLHKIPDINGNMVKPFFTKEELAIPSSYVKEYFQKFILRVVAKASISAEGFKVINSDSIPNCELTVNEDFLRNEYGLSLHFRYSSNRFRYGSKTMQKTELQFNNENDIVVYQHVRDTEREQVYIDKLDKFGIKHHYGNFFLPNELEEGGKENEYRVHEWAVENQEKFKKAGIAFKLPEIGGKQITLNEPTIQLNLNQVNDWFDIFGNFHVGQFTFPFSALADNIRNDNRFFLLPDGNYFIIPFEWMNKYAALFQIGNIVDGTLRLTKSQYTILDGFDDDSGLSGAPENLTKDFKKINYRQPAGLNATLRPYQEEGIKWLIHLYHNDLGGCLADDMGLGKTLQTIAMLLYAKTQKINMPEAVPADGPMLALSKSKKKDELDTTPLQALIIMPASLTFNWEQEIQKFAPELSIYKHIGNKRYRARHRLTGFDVILTSYHTALKDIKLLSSLDLEYLVLDESQQIKNKNTKIFEAVNLFNCEHKLTLSGTPIENSLSDLWSQMQFINPELLGAFSFFKRTFITPIEKFQDEDKKEQLKRLVSPYLLRRCKEEVAKDLPELTYEVLYTEMSDKQRKIYEKEKSAARNFIFEMLEEEKSKLNFTILSTLLKLRQIANHPVLENPKYNKDSGKFNEITHRMSMLKKGGHKVLIFSQFVTHLDLFQEWLEGEGWSYAKLTGATSQANRQKEVERFEKDPSVQFFLISIKAGGSGLNLTAADYVFIADPWWNPSVEQQAIARAHRIGQDKNVIAIKFVAKDTVEEKILKLQERKQQLADDIINNNERVSFNQKDIEYLFE